ncbi:hypothetical protein [Sulfuracidifex tepidarius]|uniref:Glycosyltransferase 2-like domain-containing protein n=1 Tax=Sulfuracidifex tepidarius TaxID=1294262 RepID=A0A510E595_9CREN|nr:hypothetical protein [Sulfuracidifex tepidarius]BBG27702.1 hypothetical protein IC007_2256 [Sulfuracidifex tepidarius]
MELDRLERLFSSEDPREVEKVYSFDRDTIVKWMKERPSPEFRVKEVEGDEEVVVVIPTADLKGDKAREASSVFSPLHVVLVESKGPLFNYSKSVNLGIMKAMERSPKWVVVSNDDVHGRDNVSKLLDGLSTSTKGMVMASPSFYHTYKVSLIEMKPYFLKGMNLIGKIGRLPPAEVYSYLAMRYGGRLGVKTLTVIDSMLGPMKRIAGEVKDSLVNVGSFMVLNRRVINGNVLDETFVNGYEDVYLSMKMRDDCEVIDFKIDEERGASLGFGKLRFFKSFVNEVYLNSLLWTKTS